MKVSQQICWCLPLSLWSLSFALILLGSCSTQVTEEQPSKFPGADSLINFIKRNKTKASVYVQKNDTAISTLNEHKLMPLASTVKIIVAIEFAKQVALKHISQDEWIPIRELDKYYLAETDGGAHPEWLEYETKEGHIKDKKIKLIDVARGMILYSSNANTEYLMARLGIDKVNDNIKQLGVKQHTAITPLVSTLFMYQKDRLNNIRNLSDSSFFNQVLSIHARLKQDTSLKRSFRLDDLTMEVQKLWSDRLPSSTTKEYVRVCQILNNREVYDSSMYAVLHEVLEFESSTGQNWFKHAGTKGGSTAFVLTEAFYATMKNGNRYEYAIFLNDLEFWQQPILGMWLNEFRLSLLMDPAFEKKLKF
jgi:D-alanyl-D-alanine carboxypeptidase